MTKETTFRIDLPTLFANVNQRRREKGLPAVEPAVMAVRASIKFAIRRQKHINLKSDELSVDEVDAQHLCEAFRELFDVELNMTPGQRDAVSAYDKKPTPSARKQTPRPTQPTMESSNNVSTLPIYQLPLVNFYAAFNQARRQKNLMPVEPAIISVRTGVKFAIMRHKAISLHATRASLDGEDLKALEQILAQQFDVVIPNGLLSLCETEQPVSSTDAVSRNATDVAEQKQRPGLIARFLGQFVGERGRERVRHYSLDTSNLLMAIVKRRAYMGHKPMSPEAIRQKCAQNLRVELELEANMHNPELELSAEQLDAFAQIIRREFQIMFDNLNDLIDEPLKTSPNPTTKPGGSNK